jgi:hypothetical protein
MPYDENDSYLKPGMKDESEKQHLRKVVSSSTKSKRIMSPPVLKKHRENLMGKLPAKKGSSPKKSAMMSVLGSLSSGAGFRN